MKLFILLFFFTFPVFSQSVSSFPAIFDGKSFRTLNTTDISKMLEKYDVLLIGEEHDDKEGHKEKLKLFEALAEDYKGKLSLSMEMFSADKQEVLDEYLSGTIREKDFFFFF